MNLYVPVKSEADAVDSFIDGEDPVVIAGGGPSGTRAAEELARRGYKTVLINAERCRPYNRVQLTPLLAGEAQVGQIYTAQSASSSEYLSRYDGVSVVDIDRTNQKVLLSSGRIQPYAKLILALGSRAFVPEIEGKDLPGVFVFRNFDDAEALLARSISARNVVVIGGGLLGLEAARGMMGRGSHVHVIEHENRLMPRQLDVDAAEVLKDRIKAIGIDVHTGERVLKVTGDERVEGIALSSGKMIAADTVIICTGVRANTQLPAGIGLAHSRGVLVDDSLRTNDPNIYAIGECAEHNGHVYGLVGPGYEHAKIAAAHIAGEAPEPYAGSVCATKLKVLGADVFSMGDFESVEQQPGVKSFTYRDETKGLYRRIFVDRGKLVAALGVGDWPEATAIQQAVSRKQGIQFWNTRRFAAKGDLWDRKEDGVESWAKDAIVCNCTGVTKGAIVDAVTLGASSLSDVRTATTANTVCGSCQPLVLQLIGEGNSKAEVAKWWRFILVFSMIAGLGALATTLLPRIPAPSAYITDDFWFNIWFDSIWKQYSGYTLLGLTVAAALIGLRKRIGILRYLGGYDVWRLVHLFIGIATALVLVWHTGFRLGDNLNFVLMASFLITLIFGAVAGLITGGEHELQNRGVTSSGAKPRSLPMWIHILAIWPLPVLLMIHILAVYAY